MELGRHLGNRIRYYGMMRLSLVTMSQVRMVVDMASKGWVVGKENVGDGFDLVMWGCCWSSRCYFVMKG